MDERPVYVMQVGNTTIKIRSALPFMTPEEQKRWWHENRDHPVVKSFKRAWIEMAIENRKKELKANATE